MSNIKYYLEKNKYIIILITIILILIICLGFSSTKKEKEVIDAKEIKEENEVKAQKINTTVKVDIKGHVENPNVYEIDSNSRIIDVINKAGGLKSNANTEYINLSKKVTDEMVIIIYSNNEVEKFKKEDKEIIYIEYECICPDNINESCITEKDTVNTNGTYKDDNNEEDFLISINTDSIDELTKLDGIGESKAKAIIEYRKEHGNFKNLEDILNVTGIGEAAYSKIKDSIKL